MPKRKAVKKAAKKKMAPKKPVKKATAKKRSTDAARAEWQRLYGDRPPVQPAEQLTVYDWAIATGRRQA